LYSNLKPEPEALFKSRRAGSAATKTMQLFINGEPKEYDQDLTLEQLLAKLGLSGKYVAVERNFEVVSFRKYAETPLRDGDRLEIVTLVGGG